MEISKKEILLITFVIALVGVYAVFFTDWFKPKHIRIEHNVRSLILPARVAAETTRTSYVVSFALDHDYKLTSVKVVAASEATNANAFALWQLAADSKSAPTKSFIYGGQIPGMKPFVSGAQPAPLEPNVAYRLIVEAGRVKGEHDFSVGAGTPGNR